MHRGGTHATFSFVRPETIPVKIHTPLSTHMQPPLHTSKPLSLLTLILLCLSATVGLDAQTVTGFTLVDVGANQDIGPLRDGDVLDLSTLPAQLNVRANTSPTVVGSVRFGYQDDANFRVENVAPYAIGGDTDGNYLTNWSPQLGTNAIRATPFTGEKASGSAGQTVSISFEVVEQAGEEEEDEVVSLPPTNLSLTAISSTELQLRWDQPATGNDYRIEFATSPDFANAQEDFLYFGYGEFIYGGFEPSTTYYFRMRTSVGGTLSDYSETVSATTLAAEEPEPTPGDSGDDSPDDGGSTPDDGDDVPDEGEVIPGGSVADVSGELRQWHTVILDYAGPTHSETDNSPNPFLDYRLDVTFTHASSGKRYVVPGYFAADGRAAETSSARGNVWRVHFTPDETGTWSYEASFRTGGGVAVNDSPNAGSAVGSIDGDAGGFVVAATNKSGRDFRGKGRLSYVGEHFLRFEGSGEYFVKGGPDAPENFLAYEDFDNTPNNGGRRKSWAPHADDYRAGDPTWQGGKGSEIIGALNYLAGEGMNAFSFLTMNINGDDRNVYPYVTSSDFTHFDVSKLDQWDVVFSYGQRRGLYLHFKTQETENDQLLDGGSLGTERKLYYRMLVARFGHHLALNWNLGEENTNSDSERKAFAQYLRDIDPYDHHIVVHTYPNQQEQVYAPLLGDGSELTGASVQTSWNNVYDDTKRWVERSAAAGKPWVVANDEQGNANVGVPPFVGYVDPSNGNRYGGTNVDHDDIRRETLWGNLIAGGAGVEYYFGYGQPQSDLTAQDYRSRDGMWDYTRYALEFFTENVPVANMRPDNGRATRGRVLADGSTTFVVQLPSGGSTDLTLPDGDFTLQWFDPRSGAFAGSEIAISGGGARSLGLPPSSTGSDWVALVQRPGDAPTTPTPPPTPSPQTAIAINAGGPAYTSTDGTDYRADAYSTGGKVFADGASVAGTTDDALYQTERYGSDFGYDIPLTDGAYAVTLRFAEIFFDQTGKRVFDVRVEGQSAVDDLDLIATAGDNVAYDVTYMVDVTGGVLDVDLVSSVENAKISAIFAAPVAGVAPRQAAPTPGALTVDLESRVFPNPTVGELNVVGEGISRVTLFDATGRVLQEYAGDPRTLDLGDYRPGNYVVEVETATGTDTHRVVRE